MLKRYEESPGAGARGPRLSALIVNSSHLPLRSLANTTEPPSGDQAGETLLAGVTNGRLEVKI
ncbi:MAG: hypothetical protein M0Z94_00145 [Dehalococcoidales bacterium]|nr:hypothetical protein [Dehalococcoidales bacterium]